MLTDLSSCSHFFFSYTRSTEIYTLSLHDALPISMRGFGLRPLRFWYVRAEQYCYRGSPPRRSRSARADRKSTRLNSSHTVISYAVFCLKKKNPSAVNSVRQWTYRTYLVNGKPVED